MFSSKIVCVQQIFVKKLFIIEKILTNSNLNKRAYKFSPKCANTMNSSMFFFTKLRIESYKRMVSIFNAFQRTFLVQIMIFLLSILCRDAKIFVQQNKINIPVQLPCNLSPDAFV